MALRQWTLVLAAAMSLGLAACHRGADSGATRAENAPGSPGTGNGIDVSRPQAADSSSGRGPSGARGSLPHPGSSGGDAPAGTTGNAGTAGTSAMGGPGAGLNGGLNPAPGQSTGVSNGTTNSSPKNSVGNRY
jgi:hypothetical protein